MKGETKGKYIGNGKYEYSCPNCGKVFTSDKKSLIGLEKLCDECFDGYCDADDIEGFADVHGN